MPETSSYRDRLWKFARTNLQPMWTWKELAAYFAPLSHGHVQQIAYGNYEPGAYAREILDARLPKR
jgi:hypothetical protein